MSINIGKRQEKVEKRGGTHHVWPGENLVCGGGNKKHVVEHHQLDLSPAVGALVFGFNNSRPNQQAVVMQQVQRLNFLGNSSLFALLQVVFHQIGEFEFVVCKTGR